jgi:hypothetical protein
VSPSSVSRAAIKLEKKGLVDRYPDEDDSRSLLILLSELGATGRSGSSSRSMPRPVTTSRCGGVNQDVNALFKRHVA